MKTPRTVTQVGNDHYNILDIVRIIESSNLADPKGYRETLIAAQANPNGKIFTPFEQRCSELTNGYISPLNFRKILLSRA